MSESDDFEARVRAEVERVLAERDLGRRWLTPTQVAERLNVAVGTLANWRVAGIGPASVKMGRLVRYEEGAVEAWADAQRR
ncbi:helix-turn-helix transcriptional regulator [Microbacterium aurantiacum]|uniref:helix-turn-helix transcriptional regulator n=1 Tax=Microbacterium aurantiacum TaxID=162393 RepID=UPI0009EB3DDD|nr:helix-turn-helix domain-containing protein [Microbacterium chocolatum]